MTSFMSLKNFMMAFFRYLLSTLDKDLRQFLSLNGRYRAAIASQLPPIRYFLVKLLITVCAGPALNLIVLSSSPRLSIFILLKHIPLIMQKCLGSLGGPKDQLSWWEMMLLEI